MEKTNEVGFLSGSKAKIDQLTSLRFFAAMLVVFYHLQRPKEPAIISFGENIFSKGMIGVDIFFFLSGFILTYVYSSALDARKTNILWDFYLARFARIYPLHFTTLCLFLMYFSAFTLVGLSSSQPERYSLESFLTSLFLIHAWGFGHDGSWNPVSWTLSAEMAAYICFPLLLPPIARVCKDKSWVFVAGLLLLIPLAEVGLYGGSDLRRIFPLFILGIIGFFTPFTLNWIKPELCALFSLFAALAVLQSPMPALYAAPFFCLMVWSLYHSTGTWLARALSWQPLVYLGELSFSIYMIHFLVQSILLNAVSHFFPSLPAESFFGIGFVILHLSIVFVASAILFHLIEVPARKWLIQTFKR